jgi:threonine/homoserine/homoserine lactone efflux protein
MPEIHKLLAFCLVSLGMVLSPGPNMIYLISRSICQGKKAGMISLAGVGTGFVFYMLCVAFGITALIFAIPYAYDTLRLGGAAYLIYLGWQAFKPGGRSAFQIRDLPADSPRKLFTMGFVTNLLNPKIAVMYLSMLPQFISPERGHVLSQSLILGTAQISISMTVNALIAVCAGSVAVMLSRRPSWIIAQRWIMGSVLFGLAAQITMAKK